MSQPSNSRSAGQALAVAEPVVGVRDEVGVERADGLLHHGPHPFTELAHHLHQLQPCPRGLGDLTEVQREQALVGLVAEFAVDAEVAEIEEDVVHPGVLEIEQPHPVVGEQHVAGQQIVVAGNESASAPWRMRSRCAGSAGADARTRAAPSPRGPTRRVRAIRRLDGWGRHRRADRCRGIGGSGRPRRRAARRMASVRDDDPRPAR